MSPREVVAEDAHAVYGHGLLVQLQVQDLDRAVREKPPAPGSIVLNFDVAGDVDVVRAALEKRGARFTGPTQIIPGKVRLAPFEDPDGYRLRLAGDDPPRGA